MVTSEARRGAGRSAPWRRLRATRTASPSGPNRGAWRATCAASRSPAPCRAEVLHARELSRAPTRLRACSCAATHLTGAEDERRAQRSEHGALNLRTPTGEHLPGELESKTNVVTEDTWLYQYDVLGNLLAVSLPDGTLIEYLVDGLGRRVGKKINSVLVKRWIYRDALKPVAELDGSGNLVAQFVYTTGNTSPELMLRGGVRYRILTDQLGSPRLVVNASTGAVVQRMRHDSFGNVLEDTNPGFVPFGFAGGLYDADTGLVRFGARDFDPLVGRWTSKDPIRFNGEDPPNLYLYASGDPVNSIDMTGRTTTVLSPWWGPIGGGLGGGLAGGAVFGIPGALVGACIGVLFFATGDSPREDDDDEECAKQWEYAHRECAKRLVERPSRQNRRLRGGHTNLTDCAKGYVQERCGGNLIDYGDK